MMKQAVMFLSGLFVPRPVPRASEGLPQRSRMTDYDQPLVWVPLLLMLFGMVMV